MTSTYSIMSFYFFYSFYVSLKADFTRGKKHITSQKDPTMMLGPSQLKGKQNPILTSLA